jgi:hypothetical protein
VDQNKEERVHYVWTWRHFTPTHAPIALMERRTSTAQRRRLAMPIGCNDTQHAQLYRRARISVILNYPQSSFLHFLSFFVLLLLWLGPSVSLLVAPLICFRIVPSSHLCPVTFLLPSPHHFILSFVLPSVFQIFLYFWRTFFILKIWKRRMTSPYSMLLCVHLIFWA